jgi:hypothetical protein
VATLLGQHQYAGCIHAQVRRAQRVDEHRFVQRPRQPAKLAVPGAQGRPRQVQAIARVDRFQPIERLMVLPASHDGVSQKARPGAATLDRQLHRLAHQHLGLATTLPVLARKLLVHQLHCDDGGRPPFQNLARFTADALECIRLPLHLGRHNFDLNPWQFGR